MHDTHSIHDQWNIDTRDSFRSLTSSNGSVDEQQDSFAWHLKQVGHLSRREFDRIDLPVLIDQLTLHANHHVFQCRSLLRDMMQFLILLSSAPAAGGDIRSHWKQELSFRRIQFQAVLRRNPSILCFLPAILRFGWHSARHYAAMDLNSCSYLPAHVREVVLEGEKPLGNWSERLTARCPWSLAEIVGFDPNNRYEALTDSFSLPFTEPAH